MIWAVGGAINTHVSADESRASRIKPRKHCTPNSKSCDQKQKDRNFEPKELTKMKRGIETIASTAPFVTRGVVVSGVRSHRDQFI